MRTARRLLRALRTVAAYDYFASPIILSTASPSKL